MDEITAIELGCTGHFICAKDCRWRRHTQVGNYRISSCGDLYYEHEPNKRQTLGAAEDSFFETMVFQTSDAPVDNNEGCGCRQVVNWCEIDGHRSATAAEAQAFHEAMVTKYTIIASKEAP